MEYAKIKKYRFAHSFFIQKQFAIDYFHASLPRKMIFETKRDAMQYLAKEEFIPVSKNFFYKI